MFRKSERLPLDRTHMATFSKVLFDLDGTLVDNTAQILDAYQHTFSKLDLAYPGDVPLKKLFGTTLESIAAVLDIGTVEIQDFIDVFRAYDFRYTPDLVVGEIGQLLNNLIQSGVSVGVVTSKIKTSALATLAGAFPDLSLDVLVAGDMTTRTKPDPEPLYLACKLLDIKPSLSIAYVGDSVHDIGAAKAAGLTSVGVTWGVAQETIEDAKPDFVVHDTADLRSVLQCEDNNTG